MCKCNCNCSKIYNTSGVLCQEGNINLIIPVDFQQPQDRQHFNFKICQRIPGAGECGNVFIVINGTTFPVLNKFGSPAFANEIECGKIYKGFYDLKHFIINAPGCQK